MIASPLNVLAKQLLINQSINQSIRQSVIYSQQNHNKKQKYNEKAVEILNTLLRVIIIIIIITKYIAVFSDMGLVGSKQPYHPGPDVHFSYSN